MDNESGRRLADAEAERQQHERDRQDAELARIAEITKNLDAREERTPFNGTIHLMPTWPEFKRILPSALRGSVIGSFLGILPGGGPVIAQFAAYAVDKKVSKYRDEIGSGAIEGVAGQAAADEAAARTSFIPLMSIGIPERLCPRLLRAFTRRSRRCSS